MFMNLISVSPRHFYIICQCENGTHACLYLTRRTQINLSPETTRSCPKVSGAHLRNLILFALFLFRTRSAQYNLLANWIQIRTFDGGVDGHQKKKKPFRHCERVGGGGRDGGLDRWVGPVGLYANLNWPTRSNGWFGFRAIKTFGLVWCIRRAESRGTVGPDLRAFRIRFYFSSKSVRAYKTIRNLSRCESSPRARAVSNVGF